MQIVYKNISENKTLLFIMFEMHILVTNSYFGMT